MTIAFVAPWYGQDIPGGAEALTRRTAARLRQAGLPVEVITTCLRDLHADWGHNHHRPGVTVENGVPVHRFPVGRRDRAAFDRVNWQLMQGQAVSAAAEATFNQEMFHCPELYAYLRQQQADSLFFFIPYMFPTTYLGAQICPERSVVIPCLHDEAYARLRIHRQVLPRVRALLFHAQAEQALADTLFPPPPGQVRQVIGAGVDTGWQGDGARFRRRFGLGDAPLVLYAGRREPGKNTPLLLRYWQQYALAARRPARLVLIGAGSVAVPPAAADSVVDLGFVSVSDKQDAYAAADVFCLPSVHESFSIVIMESWLAGTPVLVHGDCPVTREHCVQANGGLYFTNYPEFAAALDYLLDNPQTAARLGRQGRRYVLDNYRWDTIIGRYTALIDRLTAP